MMRVIFGKYILRLFTQKIDNIRNNFNLTTETEKTLSQDIKFDQFRPVSIDEIRKVITSFNSKS